MSASKPRVACWLAGAAALIFCSSAGAFESSELQGTAWRLTKIMFMNDQIDEPAEGVRYTLEFNADGDATLEADCARGTGTWTSESAGQLQFGPIAATLALCPSGSLSETYLNQMPWVRSYVLKDGHLFLATMADGSIIEFAPMSDVVASVLGEAIRTREPGELQAAILTPLLERYASEHDIAPEPSEIDRFVTQLKQGLEADGLTAEQDLTADEAAEVAAMRRDMARGMISQWKINRALYRRYGGRVAFQQLGPEPIDAYRQFLRNAQQAGEFSIEDPALAKAFWRYFDDESRHSFFEAGTEDSVFVAPPWEARVD
jgi:heat shock protein HslJ